MTTYQATATREGHWRIIHVPQIDQVTQARDLTEAKHMARDLITAYQNIPAESFTLELHLTETLKPQDDLASCDRFVTD